MLGLRRGDVFLVPWTHEWEEEFFKEKVLIEEMIEQYIVAVHHIGSTAVPHLSAKPILDIAIEIEHFGDGLHCVSPLEALGYQYRGTNVVPDRHYFNKGEPRTHQIHMYEKGNKYLLEQLHFRDYLRNNEDARIAYENLKARLFRLNKHDKHQYADDKTEFVKSALKKFRLRTIINKIILIMDSFGHKPELFPNCCPNHGSIRTRTGAFPYMLSESRFHSDTNRRFSLYAVRITMAFGHEPALFLKSCPNHGGIWTLNGAFP